MTVLTDEQITAEHVIVLDYVQLHLDAGPLCVSQQEGKYVVGDKTIWGVGYLGAITPIQQAVNGAAPQMAVTLGALDARILDLVRADEELLKGRDISVRRMLFSRDGAKLAPLGERVRVVGIMDRVIYGKKPVESETLGGRRTLHTVTITFEDFLGSRRVQASGRTWSDADQSVDHPTDRGFEFGGTMNFHTERWPIFPP